MTGDLGIAAVVGTIALTLTSVICWLCDDWYPRYSRNRQARQRRRELARQDAVDMQAYRARRRMVGGGL